MKNNTLEVDSVICGFGYRDILTDVYLKCQTGEIIGILGRNGSGKSTLLKIIFGTQHTSNKNIRVNKKVYQYPFVNKNLISYLPQHNFLPQSITIRGIVSRFIPAKENREIIFEDKIIAQHLDKRIYELSGGESRYLQILLLLNLETQFILLDEPFSALAPLYRDEIKELLLKYKHTKGFIVTDHDYRNIIDISDNLKLLVNGVCKHIKSLDELELWGYVPEGTFS